MALRSEAKDCLSELGGTSFYKRSHFSFYFLLTCIELLATVANLFSFTTTALNKVNYFMLKHFLLQVRIFSSNLQFFPTFVFLSVHLKTFIHYSHLQYMRASRFPAFFRTVFLTSCISKPFDCILLSPLLFFLK